MQVHASAASVDVAHTRKTPAKINGFWYIDYDGNGTWDNGVADKVYGFGWGGVTPLVGDWNGNGREKIGIFVNGTWYLDTNGDGVFGNGVDLDIREHEEAFAAMFALAAFLVRDRQPEAVRPPVQRTIELAVLPPLADYEGFIPLPNSAGFAAVDTAEEDDVNLVRVEVPRSAMIALGLAIIGPLEPVRSAAEDVPRPTDLGRSRIPARRNANGTGTHLDLDALRFDCRRHRARGAGDDGISRDGSR